MSSIHTKLNINLYLINSTPLDVSLVMSSGKNMKSFTKWKMSVNYSKSQLVRLLCLLLNTKISNKWCLMEKSISLDPMSDPTHRIKKRLQVVPKLLALLLINRKA